MRIPKNAKGLKIVNGYAKSKYTYQINNRVKNVYMAFFHEKRNDPPYCKDWLKYELAYHTVRPRVELLDTSKPQEILFNSWEYYDSQDFTTKSKYIYVAIGIGDVYPGEKYDDTCISEISVIK